MKREFIQKLTYDVNNGEKMELIQRGHNGTVLICDKSASKTDFIPAAVFVLQTLTGQPCPVYNKYKFWNACRL